MLTSAHGARLIPVGPIAHGPAEEVEALVIVVHGGKANSMEPVRPWRSAVLRLRPVARRIAHDTTSPRAAVYRLQLAIRGWNGTGSSALADLYWALATLQSSHPDRPVVLVGHSMGARTVLHLAGQEKVCGVVVLAPWVETADPVSQLAGVRVTAIQGTQDRITPEPASRAFVARAEAAGAQWEQVLLTGTGHGMVSRAKTWHRLTAEAVRADLDRCIADRRSPGRG